MMLFPSVSLYTPPGDLIALQPLRLAAPAVIDTRFAALITGVYSVAVHPVPARHLRRQCARRVLHRVARGEATATDAAHLRRVGAGSYWTKRDDDE